MSKRWEELRKLRMNYNMQIGCTNISIRLNFYDWPHMGHPLHRRPIDTIAFALMYLVPG